MLTISEKMASDRVLLSETLLNPYFVFLATFLVALTTPFSNLLNYSNYSL